jgi:BirA family biotin operon repressor/biotin-[acetyl-CoA-carboxylase] ligase
MSTLENTPYLSPVSYDRAKTALHGTRFADLRWVEQTGSTNADLAAAARDGAGECALVADHQTAGRGRLDRRWEAPSGAALLMSVLVRPPFPAHGPHLLVTLLGLSALDALDPLDVHVGLKWPNDVVAVGAGGEGVDLKLGGLLAELVTGAGGEAVVVGIGLNVAWQGVDFPEEFAGTATAVDLLGASIDRGALVAALLESFGARSGELADPTACDELTARYRERCVTLGRRVRVHRPTGELVGTASDVHPDGSLVVVDDAGVAHHVTVGDVVHLRPA